MKKFILNELPSPLREDETPVSFLNVRSREIRDFYEKNFFGCWPEHPEQIQFKLIAEKFDALNGNAVRREVMICFANKGKFFEVPVLWYLPKKDCKSPCIVAMNFCGNAGAASEADVQVDASTVTPGDGAKRWPFEYLIESGFSVMTSPRNSWFPDQADGRKDSIFQLFHPEEELGGDNRELTAISAWAFGYSMMLELAESAPEVDRHNIWAQGHSRLGKSALWAGAQEKRFAGIISNDSGCCGAALFRAKCGERLWGINNSFPWWFCRGIEKFGNRDDELDFDQHFLLSLIAPRPLLIVSASEDEWADPQNEFNAAKAVSEVYNLFGSSGVAEYEFPTVNKMILAGNIGYALREGKHGVECEDWRFVIDFIRGFCPRG